MAPDDVLPPALHPEARPLVGMVHLLPLPGSPRWGGSMEAVLDRALRDAEALLAGGMDALLVENFGDVPFRPGPVEPWTTAAMTRAVEAVRGVAGDADGAPVGVNVLRNDAATALGVAAATGAAFVRVNVHTGVAFSDQGVLTGRADETLRDRRSLGASVAIVADVHVKHATPPAGSQLEDAARDARHRGLADVLVVTGRATGTAAAGDDLRRVREAVPDAPLWVGSGVTPERAPALRDAADGFIVGSWLHRDGAVGRGIDRDRVARLVDAFRG